MRVGADLRDVGEHRCVHQRCQRLAGRGVDVRDGGPDRVLRDLQRPDVDLHVDDVARGGRVVGFVEKVVAPHVPAARQVVAQRVVLLPLQPQPRPRHVPVQLRGLDDRLDPEPVQLGDLVVEPVVVGVGVRRVGPDVLERGPVDQAGSARVSAQRGAPCLELIDGPDARTRVERRIRAPGGERGEEPHRVDGRVVDPRAHVAARQVVPPVAPR